MFGLIFDYVKQHKWMYLLIAVLIIVYDVTLLIPTQVIQRLVDQLSHETMTAGSLTRDMVILAVASGLNYLSAYIWHYKLFQGSVNFKFGMQQRAFKKLVTMRTPFYEKISARRYADAVFNRC